MPVKYEALDTEVNKEIENINTESILYIISLVEMIVKHFYPEFEAKITLKEQGLVVIPKYDEVADVDQSYSNFLDYREKSKGIPQKWQTIKIRYKLGSMYTRFGYPVRKYQYIGYFSGVGLWLPINFVVMQQKTMILWERHPEKQWREIIIAEVPKSTQETWNVPSGKQIDDKIIWGLDALFGLFGINFGSMVDSMMTSVTDKWYPIYQHLGFKNTINDVLIARNYDKIYDEIFLFENNFDLWKKENITRYL